MSETLSGNDAIVAMVLEKVELAARRAVADKYSNITPADSLLQAFAEQLHRIVKDMYARPR